MKENTLQAMRALSNIEGFLIHKDDIPSGIIGEHIDFIFEYLKEDLGAKD